MSLLRVWHIVNPPAKPTFFAVTNPVEGAKLINRLAKNDLKKKSVFANALGLEEMQDDGEWCEWYDPETGDDIDTLCDEVWDSQ